jgi:hypothetical protein
MWHSAYGFSSFVLVFLGLLILYWYRQDAQRVQMFTFWLIFSVCQVVDYAIPQRGGVSLWVGCAAILVGLFCYFRKIQLFRFRHDRD